MDEIMKEFCQLLCIVIIVIGIIGIMKILTKN